MYVDGKHAGRHGAAGGMLSLQLEVMGEVLVQVTGIGLTQRDTKKRLPSAIAKCLPNGPGNPSNILLHLDKVYNTIA